MKKLLFSFVLLSVWSGVSAEQISVSQAASIAEKYLGEAVNVGQNLAPAKMKGLQMSAESPEYYVFNSDGKKGFVIISGDDELTELVGYSNEGEFRSENAPDNLCAWLDGYAAFVRSVRNGEREPMRRAFGQGTPVVAPLVATRWNQGEPYNLFCPFDPYKKVTCPTGCAATAMAQLINYHEWPSRGNGSKSYQSNYGILSVDFTKSVYDWANMKDRYESYYDANNNIVNEWNDTEARAVAKLMYDCGVALEMGYTPNSSGATDAEMPVALCNYFNYHADLITHDGYSDDEFLGIIKDELDSQRPVIFNGLGSGGGHSYIVDGYDSNSYLHVNWGWGGVADGYFNVNYMNPSDLGIGGGSGGFNYMQTVILANPDKTGKGSCGQNVLRLIDKTIWEGGDGYVKPLQETVRKGEDFVVEYLGVWNTSQYQYYGQLALGVFAEDGEMLSVSRANGVSIACYGIIFSPATLVVNKELASLADGNYTLRLISRQDKYENWTRVAVPGIDLTVSGNSVEVELPVIPKAVVSCEKMVANTPQIDVGGTVEIDITLKNDSDYDFLGKMALLVYNDETNRKTLKTLVDVFAGKNSESVSTVGVRFMKNMRAGRYRVEVEELQSSNDVEVEFSPSTATCYVEVASQSGVSEAESDRVRVTSCDGFICIGGTEEPVDVYGLSGELVCRTADRKIAAPAPGIYIVKIGGKVWKVAVR